MSRFVIEHLPRIAARYQVAPLDYVEAKAWIARGGCHSLVRTTELVAAIQEGMGFTLTQTDQPMVLQPGDEAVLISLSFGVLLAAVEGKIPPLPEDWRCSLLRVESGSEELLLAGEATEEFPGVAPSPAL